MSIKLRQFPFTEALQDAVFNLLTQTIENPPPPHAPFAILLAGGSTPLPVYSRLTDAPIIPANGLHIGFTDDRHVPADSPDSNYGNVLPLLKHLSLPPSHVIHVDADLALDESARAYSDRLETFLSNNGSIELAIVGLGSDGHTCSIFTPEAARDEESFAFAVQGEAGFNRISIGRRVLLATRRIIFLVSGAAKLQILERFTASPLATPAGLAIKDHPGVELWTDVSFVPGQ